MMLKAPVLGVFLLLGAQLAASYALTVAEQPPAAPSLDRIPVKVGAWNQVGEMSMAPDVQAYLRPDAYIDRNYQAPNSRINLFVAYFKSVKSGYGPHSPAVCLPGSGWMPKQFEVSEARVPGGSIPVNLYILEKDQQSMMVMYWYQNQRRAWAEEFRAKIYMLPDLLRYRRSDVALVRVIAPLDVAQMSKTRSTMFTFVSEMYQPLAAQLSAN